MFIWLNFIGVWHFSMSFAQPTPSLPKTPSTKGSVIMDPTTNVSIRDRRPSTTACLCCVAMGTNKVKKCALRNIIFCTRAARAGQKSIVPGLTSPITNQGRIPFHMYFLSPHLPQFQQSAGATHLWSLWSAFPLKVHKREIFFVSDFEFFTIL